MPLRYALFDMDDVLCHYDVDRRIERLAGLGGTTPAAVKARIWDSGFLDEADRGGPWTADAFLAEFGRRLGAPVGRDAWVEARRIAMLPFNDVLQTLGTLSATTPIGILTNNDALVGETLDTLFPALRPLFGERILVSAELGLAKPDPDCFVEACRRLGFVPEETFFTDDRPENVEGARAAGLKGHVFRDHAGLVSALRGAGFAV
ncbi:HAD family hydrolase [Alsobacter sp. R-9]